MGFDQRMSLRNTPAVFASIVMMVFSTVSCQPAAPPPEPVVLQFAYPNIDNEFYTRLADVFHDEYPGHAISFASRRTGITSVNVLPAPTVVVSSTRPP